MYVLSVIFLFAVQTFPLEAMQKTPKKKIGNLAFDTTRLFLDKNQKLLSACKRGHAEQAIRLLQKKKPADINVKDSEDSTPLLLACWNNHADVVVALIDYCEKQGIEINIEAKNFWGHTALLQACKNNNTELALFLIQKGASVWVVDFNGESPLYLARLFGNVELTRVIERKIGSNCLKKYLKMHLNASHNEISLNVALRMGANINWKVSYYKKLEKGKKNPIYCWHRGLGFQKKYNLLMRAIRRRNGLMVTQKFELTRREQKFLERVISEKYEYIRYLIKFGVDVNAINCLDNHDIPLSLACRNIFYKGNRQIIFNLIAAGAVIRGYDSHIVEAQGSQYLQNLLQKQDEMDYAPPIKSNEQERSIIQFIKGPGVLMYAKQIALEKLLAHGKIVDKTLLKDLFKKIVFNCVFLSFRALQFEYLEVIALQDNFLDICGHDIVEAVIIFGLSGKNTLEKFLYEKLIAAPIYFYEHLKKYARAARRGGKAKLCRGLYNMFFGYRGLINPTFRSGVTGLCGGNFSHMPHELVLTQIAPYVEVKEFALCPYIGTKELSFRYR